jgi:hypothetical protein
MTKSFEGGVIVKRNIIVILAIATVIPGFGYAQSVGNDSSAATHRTAESKSAADSVIKQKFARLISRKKPTVIGTTITDGALLRGQITIIKANY